MGDIVSLMDRPVYTCPQVDRLLGLSRGTAERWLNGYQRRGVEYQPVLRPERSDSRWVTWGEFVEARLFAFYRDNDAIPGDRLRAYVEDLRRKFDRRYPLAYSSTFIRPEGKRMLWEAQQVAGIADEFAIEVGTNQIVLTPKVEQFVSMAEFAPDNGEAFRLRPDADFPDVYLDPTLRGGEPTVGGRNVRVATLAGLIRGGERPEDVADWYNLTADVVRQAVGYDSVHPHSA